MVAAISSMAAVSIHKTAPLILDKLNGLLGILYEVKFNCERIASNFRNRELSQSVISVTQESKQYASELRAQIQSLGGVAEEQSEEHEMDKLYLSGEKDWIIQDKEKAALGICAGQEASVVKAYREVLHEPFLQDGVRKMIRYQLNGILFAFSRLKLLNAVIPK